MGRALLCRTCDGPASAVDVRGRFVLVCARCADRTDVRCPGCAGTLRADGAGGGTCGCGRSFRAIEGALVEVAPGVAGESGFALAGSAPNGSSREIEGALVESPPAELGAPSGEPRAAVSTLEVRRTRGRRARGYRDVEHDAKLEVVRPARLLELPSPGLPPRAVERAKTGSIVVAILLVLVGLPLLLGGYLGWRAGHIPGVAAWLGAALVGAGALVKWLPLAWDSSGAFRRRVATHQLVPERGVRIGAKVSRRAGERWETLADASEVRAVYAEPLVGGTHRVRVEVDGASLTVMDDLTEVEAVEAVRHVDESLSRRRRAQKAQDISRKRRSGSSR